MKRRCQNPDCHVPGGKILGRFAHESIKICRECRNVTNRRQAEEKQALAQKKTDGVECKTDGCGEIISTRSRTGLCKRCRKKQYREDQKIPCGNPACENKVSPPKDGKGTSGLC